MKKWIIFILFPTWLIQGEPRKYYSNKTYYEDVDQFEYMERFIDIDKNAIYIRSKGSQKVNLQQIEITAKYLDSSNYNNTYQIYEGRSKNHQFIYDFRLKHQTRVDTIFVTTFNWQTKQFKDLYFLLDKRPQDFKTESL